MHLAQLDENRRTTALATGAHAKRMKAQYDRSVTPCIFSEGDLVLVYDQANDKLGLGNSNPCGMVLILSSDSLQKGPMN